MAFELQAQLKHFYETRTLLDCAARFNGEYNPEKVCCFLNFVRAYKDIKRITDEQALAELPYLLEDHAFVWWQSSQNKFKTWLDAVQSLQLHFSQVRPTYAIYADIFGKFLDTEQSLLALLNDKLLLFAQLPKPQPTEQMQLDMFYGLIPSHIPVPIQRGEVHNFAELKERLKALETIETIEVGNVNLTEEPTDNTIEMKTEAAIDDPKNCKRKLLAEAVVSDTNNNSSNSNCVLAEAIVEPYIKVRRTEDLMPALKEEPLQEVEEFLSEPPSEAIILNKYTHIQAETTSSSNETIESIDIDTELMTQITDIIKECANEPNELISFSRATTVEEQPISSIINSTVAITQLPNTPINNYKNCAKICVKTTKNRKKSGRFRCHNCCAINHITSECTIQANNAIRMKNLAVPLPKSLPQKPKAPVLAPTTITTTTTTITTPTTTSQPHLPIITITDSQHPNAIHHTTTGKAKENHAIKLIPAAEVPSSPKGIVAKLKASNNCTVRCHQCGNAGFYRSICPNCSPIYNYKPSNGINR